ncbi:hypothetical protein GCM10010497_06490 [Streptomyces cinereoruber]|uniref:Uncharacterized protein n=1 Tax=Streptomyces cinereoruber TaxID=67260 RepID=A0AAV4KCA3_9ACTN|nr:hypothetical protein GCM10010497_06490 [Streptomyces cinereoruber]
MADASVEPGFRQGAWVSLVSVGSGCSGTDGVGVTERYRRDGGSVRRVRDFHPEGRVSEHLMDAGVPVAGPRVNTGRRSAPPTRSPPHRVTASGVPAFPPSRMRGFRSRRPVRPGPSPDWPDPDP